jgi:hypothetical protein
MEQDHPTKTRYDSKKKCITVETLFGVDIRLKFKAPREEWLRAWESLDFGTLTLADVKPFLSRNPRKAVEALAELAEKHQAIFAQAFLNCVLAANFENPLDKLRKKSRGTPYSDLDTWEVAKLTLYLDAYLNPTTLLNKILA